MYNFRKPLVYLTGSIGITSISYIAYSIYNKDSNNIKKEISGINIKNEDKKENLRLRIEGKILNDQNKLIENNINKKFTYYIISEI